MKYQPPVALYSRRSSDSSEDVFRRCKGTTFVRVPYSST